ncbi:MAG: anthranilate synthase component I [ANME-2 cluster archaeon]|nr:anthranilate synthase component I [ANME-2 cluster archaeon]
MIEAQFDLTQTEFCNLAKENRPAIIQLSTKTSARCTPFELYLALQEHNGGACKYSYLLESVEKEQRHARFSFVGADPDAVVTVKDRVVTLEYPVLTPLIKHVSKNLGSVCEARKEKDHKNYVTGPIKQGFDTLDAIRAAFPAKGAEFLNSTTFDRQTFLGGIIGFNSYDLVHDCWLDKRSAHMSDYPDAQFALVSRTVVFDHLTDIIHVVITPFIDEDDDAASVYLKTKDDAEKLLDIVQKAEHIEFSPGPQTSVIGDMVCNMDQLQYEEAVRRARQHIIDGDIFQVVPSRRYELDIKQTPMEIYHTLREVNPSPYMYLFEFDGTGIIGASPETLMTVHNGKVITNPIAGTCPRGATPEEDEQLAQTMLSDEKERAEHVMLVDLGRNDVRMVSRPGTVKVEDFMSALKYSHVQHIESTVTGLLRDECDQFDATRAIFPAGTLSGAPKIRAMEIIDELETTARGPYGGGVGYYSLNGDADFAIVIRTVIMQGGKAYIQAGAGIVADSDPTYEYNETERKMAAMIKALGGGT